MHFRNNGNGPAALTGIDRAVTRINYDVCIPIPYPSRIDSP